MNQPDPQPELVLRKPFLSTGTTIGGRYQIIRVLGTGGMGSVYLAQNTSIEQKVAIKVLESHFFHQPMQVQRFMREARAICKIHHENVIYLSDFGYTDDQIPFIVMEYLEGEDLLHTLKREGSLSWQQGFNIMRQICAGLEAAHSCGVVHRDLKPSNCFRIARNHQEDWIKLIDFGIAKFRDDSHSGITQTGVVMGTPAYMSPEQAKSDDLDLRSDLYSAAVILYRMLCGRLPFEGERAIEVVLKHVTVAPPSLAEAAPHRHFHPRLEMEMTKALAKRPEERFQSAKDFFIALAEVDALAKQEKCPVVADKSPIEVTSPEVKKVEKHPNQGLRHPRILGFFSGLAILGVTTLSLWWNTTSNEDMRNQQDLFQESVKPLIDVSPTSLRDTSIVFAELQEDASVELHPENSSLPATEALLSTTTSHSPLHFDESSLEQATVNPNGSTKATSETLQSHQDEKIHEKAQINRSRTGKKTIPRRSRQALQKALKRIESHVQTCLAEGGFPGQSVHVEVVVAEDGTIQQVNVLGSFAGSALGLCIQKTVRKAQFSRGEKVDTVAYQFRL